MTKICNDCDSAVLGLFDGARVMVSGFGLCGNPEQLIRAVVRSGKRNLTVISNNVGNLGKGLSEWLTAGIISHVVCTYIGNNELLHQQMATGQVTVDVLPQGTFVERIRAKGAGIPAFYTPTGVGTVVATGKEQRDFSGTSYLLETALEADFALVRAKWADDFGNLRFWRTAQNFGLVMAMAASTTIVEADTIEKLGGLDPDDIHLPGVFVNRIVHVPVHEDPFEYRTTRAS